MLNFKVVCIGLFLCVHTSGKPLDSKLHDVFNSSNSEGSLTSKFLRANNSTDQPTGVPTDQQTYADIYESMSFQFPWRDDDDDYEYDSDEEQDDNNEISDTKVPVEHFEVVMVNANDQKTEEINTKLSPNFRYTFTEPNDLLNQQFDDESHDTNEANNEISHKTAATKVHGQHLTSQRLGTEKNEATTTKSTDITTTQKLFTSTALKNSSKHNNKSKMVHQETAVASKDAEVTSVDDHFDEEKKPSPIPHKTTEAPKRRTSTSRSVNNKQKCNEDNASIESIWERIKNFLLDFTAQPIVCVEVTTAMPVKRNYQFPILPRNYMLEGAYL